MSDRVVEAVAKALEQADRHYSGRKPLEVFSGDLQDEFIEGQKPTARLAVAAARPIIEREERTRIIGLVRQRIEMHTRFWREEMDPQMKLIAMAKWDELSGLLSELEGGQ